jgi:hypothetical protein
MNRRTQLGILFFFALCSIFFIELKFRALDAQLSQEEHPSRKHRPRTPEGQTPIGEKKVKEPKNLPPTRPLNPPIPEKEEHPKCIHTIYRDYNKLPVINYQINQPVYYCLHQRT